MADDPDQPAGSLLFSLGAGAPADAYITSDGFFYWVPAETDGGVTYTFDVNRHR